MRFRAPLRFAPWPNGPHTSRKCVVCGELWLPWKGSRLTCHARCLLTEPAQLALLDDPRSNEKIAEDLGVTTAVVRASIFAARKLR